MKRVRITYPGAHHHVMNRGFDGKKIFLESYAKAQFLSFLKDAVKKLKIRIFAYVIMDTHYHLILENSSGRMSDCLKLLNGKYGAYYRKLVGGQGYVFQGRYKSTLIENDSYLIQSLLYLFQNPVRSGIVPKAEDYLWSSVNLYFSGEETGIVDTSYIHEMFESKEKFFNTLNSGLNRGLTIKETKFGELLGNDGFMQQALQKHNRRTRPTDQSKGTRRVDERYFETVEKVVREFEKKIGITIDKIDTRTLAGKRWRGELLVQLKNRTGLKYKEIGELGIFKDLSFASMRSIYRNMK